MTTTRLVTFLAMCGGCAVGQRRLPAAAVGVKATVRADVRVESTAVVSLAGAPVPEFFGIPLDGAQDVVFVVDRSGSMIEPAGARLAPLAAPRPAAPPPPTVEGQPPAPPPAPPQPRKIDVAQDELVDALVRLPPGTRFNVLFFDGGVAGYAAELTALDELRRDEVIAYVRAAAASGATALVPAMRTAYLMRARRIILLSDGQGNVGGGADVALREVREAVRGDVRVDTIGLGPDQDARLLQALAAETGGLYQAL
ncbi:MAG: hypothetical protein R2939_20135 [Kofleriaceae bacterium]